MVRAWSMALHTSSLTIMTSASTQSSGNAQRLARWRSCTRRPTSWAGFTTVHLRWRGGGCGGSAMEGVGLAIDSTSRSSDGSSGRVPVRPLLHLSATASALGARWSIGLRAEDAAALDATVPYRYYQSEVFRFLEVVELVGARIPGLSGAGRHRAGAGGGRRAVAPRSAVGGAARRRG